MAHSSLCTCQWRKWIPVHNKLLCCPLGNATALLYLAVCMQVSGHTIWFCQAQLHKCSLACSHRPPDAVKCMLSKQGCVPGASAVPASMEPHITVEAPRASAFTMCPEFWMPPSAIMGTPARAATRPTWYTAVAWPRPTAQTCMQAHQGPQQVHWRWLSGGS